MKTCEQIKNQILLEDKEGLPSEVLTHLEYCESCREFHGMIARFKTSPLFAAKDEPSLDVLNEVKREIRRRVPSRSLTVWRRWRPALVMAASFVVLLAFVLQKNTPQTANVGIVLTEMDVLDSQEQVANAMNDSFSEDDLAFNFVMTYDGTL